MTATRRDYGPQGCAEGCSPGCMVVLLGLLAGVIGVSRRRKGGRR
jgi:hypothetical protein